MALDTYASMWRRVLLHCPLAGQFLARSWIDQAFRRVAERRAWSWLIKRGQFLSVAAYTTGTVTVLHNSTAVVGSGTTFVAGMVGRQFVVSGAPIYTISAVTDATNLTLDDEYGGDSDTSANYSIYKAYHETTTDFHSFISVWDAEVNNVLDTTWTQRELNGWDPERTNTGDPYGLAFLDYYVPSGQTVAVPRYELWPHPITQHVYPFLYESRPTDLADTSATLPRFLHGDVLVEMALEQAALWPGPSATNPNPYFNRDLARHHRDRAEQLIMEMERQDEEVGLQNVQYPIGEAYLGDADYMQKHDF